ncbi:MAG TPA: host attachment protein [Caulobacterales bacterium]|nr:host attachment protein [Caulobacterales bacterium]
MLEPGRTWFVVADGRRARVLVEERRGAPLAERDDWAMSISPDDTYDPQDRPPRSFDRVGAGRHAMDKGRNLHEQEQVNFLNRVAARLGEAAKHGAFAHLVLAAPPRALGLLREALPAPAASRICADLAKDVVEEDNAALRERLTGLLRGSA